MDWKTVAESGLPQEGERVMVETEEGSQLYAVRYDDKFNPGDSLWWDDAKCIIRSPVVKWTRLVSLDATPSV